MTFRLAVLVAALATMLHAQSADVLRTIAPGQTVRITDHSGKRQTGTWKAAAGDAATITTSHGEVSVPHAQIRRVERKTPGRRLRNMAIGAGIGVAAGATIDNTLGVRLRNESSGSGGRAISYLASIGLCAGLGALTGGWKTVYQSR